MEKREATSHGSHARSRDIVSGTRRPVMLWADVRGDNKRTRVYVVLLYKIFLEELYQKRRATNQEC
jgi:hypothetical protein